MLFPPKFFASIVHLYGRDQQARELYRFPAIPKPYRYKTPTEAVLFWHVRTCRRTQNRESKAQSVKGLPARDAQEFCAGKSVFCYLKITVRL